MRSISRDAFTGQAIIIIIISVDISMTCRLGLLEHLVINGDALLTQKKADTVPPTSVSFTLLLNVP